MKTSLIVFTFFLLFAAIPVYSQNSDDSTKVYFSDFRFFADEPTVQELNVDTVFDKIYFFDVLQQQQIALPKTGNPGSASFNIFDVNYDYKIFNDGFNQFDPYLLKPIRQFPSSVSERRMTNINYHLGSKKEQHIFISHEQKIKSWMIAGLDLGAMASPGDFSRQKNTNRSFDVWFAYQAPANSYRAYISFTANKVENEENGGISSDDEFENATSLDTRTLAINLTNASIRHKSRDYVLKQDLNFLKLFSKADSVSKSQNFNEGSLVLSHSLWWNRKSVLFRSQDADSGYFPNQYLDTLITFDSTFYNDLYNQAMLTYTTKISNAGNSFSIGGGVNNQQVEYFTSVADSVFNSMMAVVTAGFNSRKVGINFSYSKSVDGDFDESYSANASILYLINKTGDKAFLNINTSKTPQSLRDRLYISNHFIWDNNFPLEELNVANAGFELAKYKTGVVARVTTAKNIIFYREDYLPQIYNKNVLYGDVSITKIFKYGKFGMDDKITFGFSGNENVIRIPATAIYASVYFTDQLFKNALGFKAGLDFTWYSSYNNYGYMPATGIFYLQDEKKIGSYPFVALFVSMKIKSANLFFRIDHLNAGIGERTYYGAYHYPLPGRTFKFGITWSLVD